MTLRDQVSSMVGDGEELKPEDFSNLILDELKITQFSEDDKKFLEEFTTLELLAANNTGIKSLVNLPELPKLQRIEVADNHMSGAELKHLLKYPLLATIKFGANNVREIDELKVLRELPGLQSLDLSENPVVEKEGYREQVLALLPGLQVLDGLDREGHEVISDDEEDEYDDEEGEQEALGDDDEEAEFNEEDYDDEDELDDDDSEEAGLGKRPAEDDSEEEAPRKRHK